MTKDSFTYTVDELREMIRKMRSVSTAFYPAAVGTGVHAFVEMTGLMNEFIKICEQSLAAEVDFASSNTHSGKPLVVHPFNAAYIVEKLDCIFGPSIQSSKEVEAEFAKLAPGPVNEARAWAEKTVQEIAAARILTCVYCGHQYPDGTPDAKHAALTEHIQTCEKHPMTELRNKVRALPDRHHTSEEMTRRMTFELSEAQVAALEAWRLGQDAAAAKLQAEANDALDRDLTLTPTARSFKKTRVPLPYYGPTGGELLFMFRPTTVGLEVTVQHAVTGVVLELSNDH